MKNGKSVSNGSNGRSMSGTMNEGLAHASKDIGIGKVIGSPELAPNVVGASPGPLALARGHATPPNPGIGEVQTPNPEVRIRRRNHTRNYKLSILKQAEKLKGKTGAIGELLRREGLYSSALIEWRRQRDEGLLGQTRGKKPMPAEVVEIGKLKKTIVRLEEKNRQYALVIEAQKKISEILGIHQDNIPAMPDPDEDE